MILDDLSERFTSTMKWYDFAMLKLSVFFLTLFLVVVWPGFRNFILGFDWYLYLIIALVLSGVLMKKAYSGNTI